MGSFMLVFIGIVFKAYHWLGANISIILSSVWMILSRFIYAIRVNRLAGHKQCSQLFQQRTYIS